MTCDLALVSSSEISQSKLNSRWVAGPIGQTNRRPTLYFYFCIFAKNSTRNHEKK